MILTARNNANRCGVTLVELLVVISIITLLAAFAIPAMQPALDGRRVRIAARAVRVYLGSAQLHAIENRRPVGVLFERFETEPRACRVLRQVEVPPPYAGDFDDSMIRLAYNPAWPANQNAIFFTQGENPVNPPVGAPLVQSGDVLQLNFQGHLWEMTFLDPTAGPPWRVIFSSQTTPLPPANAQNGGMITAPFQIFRQPVPSAVPPLQLPRGTVIDLDDSGYQNGLSTAMLQGAPGAVDVFAALDRDLNASPPPGQFDPNGPVDPVIIMFSPSGSVDRVYRSDYDSAGLAQLGIFRSTRAIFLMIGKWDRSGEPGLLPEDGLHNWQDAENLWLALNPKTGLVTVAELNADLPPGNPANPTADRYLPSSLYASRSYAREAQISRGGR